MDILIIVGVVVIALILIVMTGYVKSPSDTAYIISGLKKEPKYVIGRSSIRIPFLQRMDKLMLKMISVDVKTEDSVPTNDYINVNIDSAVKVKVSSDPAKMKIAASNFLNKNEEYIRSSVVDVLQGNVREIIGQMKLEEIVQDRKKFADKVQENAAPDMAKMGLDIVSFNVQNVTDNGNVIENLGIDRVVSISKSAQISRAESERDIAVAKASAEKQANDARVEAETAIAEQNNALEIKKQELKKQSDIKKAEADAAYEIQEQEQRKTIEIATADANIAKQEKEAEIKEKEIAVKEKSLDAEVKKQADAEKYARIQKADADKYEAEQRAEAEKITKLKEAEAIQARSIAEAEGTKAKGIAEAEGTKAKGIAEAEAIKAKGLAEAEAMEKKAEAMAKYGKAAMTDMIIKVLPQMAEAIAKPLESIDKVSIIGGAGDSGMSTISDNVPQVLAKTIESVKETTGFDLTEVMKANTYDARVNNNLNITTDLENKVVEKVVNEAVTDIEDNVPNTVAPDIDIAVHNEPVNAPKTHKNKKN
jgi:flotillin